jgi:hypothetical protein
MAVTRDANLGTNSINNVAGTTITLTTGAAAASNTEVLVGVFTASDAAATVSVADNSGNGYTWAQIGDYATTGGHRISIFGTYATSGLASGTVITATVSVSLNYKMICGVSYNGVASSSATDVTNTRATSNETTWSGAAVTTTNANDLIFGLDHTTGAGTPTSAPGTDWTEVHDFSIAAQVSLTTVERIVAATSTYTPTGTWSSSQSGAVQVHVTISLKEASGGISTKAGKGIIGP